MEFLRFCTVTGLSIFGLLVLAGCGADTPAEEPAQTSSTIASSSPSAAAVPTALKTTDENYPLANGTCISPDSVARYSAESVGRAYIGISYCWDSTVDSDMQAGTERARPLMSEQWAQTVLESDQSQRRNTLQYQFIQAAEHQAYTKLRIYRTSSHLDQQGKEHSSTEAENSPDQDTDGPVLSEEGYETATVGYTVYWDWVGRDGVKLSGGRAQVMVYLENHQDGWTVVGAVPTVFEES